MERRQNPQLLSMVGLGTAGGQALADGSQMDPGIHLRWQLGDAMGFPPGGFDLYRREQNLDIFNQRCAYLRLTDAGSIAWFPKNPGYSLPVAELAASGQVTPFETCGQLFGILLPGEQSLKIVFTEPIRHVRITLDQRTLPTPTAAAFWKSRAGEVMVAQERAQRQDNQEWLLRLFADHIDSVILAGEDLMPCEICLVLVDDGYDWDWGQIPLNGATPIYLPITHPQWNSPHPHSPDDQAEAEARLPAGLPADKRQAYAGGFNEDLHGILYGLVGTRLQHLYQLTEQDESGALIQWPGMQLLELMALDPNLARLLGLYWRDQPPDSNRYYDYRLVAHYQNQPFPGRHYDFSRLEDGRRYGFLLEHEGLVYSSPNPIEVVRSVWDGSEWNALFIASTIPEALFAIQLPRRVDSISLAIRTEAKLTARGFSRNWQVAELAVVAGEQTLDLESPQGIDTVLLKTGADFNLFEIVLREKSGPLNDVVYTSFHHRVEPPPAIAAPELESPAVIPTITGLGADGVLSVHQSSVGLRWSLPEAGASFLKPNAPILYQVRRAYRGDGEQPGPRSEEILLNQAAPTLVTHSRARPGSGANQNRSFYTDRHLPEGWYAYQVRGIDLFGRLGAWSALKNVRAIERLAPPPPLGVAAAYLDPADPWLSQADKDWALANGPGLKVSWEWPGMSRLQAPDIAPPEAEFRVYSFPGELNTLSGNVHQVSTSGAASELATDLVWNGAAGALAGESIRVGADFFEVIGNSRGPDCTILVKNLAAPGLAPEPGPCTLVFSPERGYWRDYRDTRNWERRLYTVPAADIPNVTGQVLSVEDYAEDSNGRPGATRTVITNQDLVDEQGVLTPGALFCEGIVYQAYGHTLDPLEIHILPHLSPAGSNIVIEPPAGAFFEYYPGLKYEVLIAGFNIPVGPARGTAAAHVAVSCSDGSPRIADDPTWDAPGRGGLGGRPGNEGPISPACRVMAVQRALPAAPGDVPAAGEPIYASPANYYGQARYTLAWQPVAGAAGYAVYRCSGAGLFDHDRRQRQYQKDYYATHGVFADDPGFASWLAGYDPLLTADDLQADPGSHLDAWQAWAERFYPLLTGAQIQELVDRAGGEQAFSRVNKDPVAGRAYTDYFDGRGQGFYLYRVRALDAADNLGAWSETYPPVHIFDVTPPAMPSVSSVLGGDRSIQITWRVNREADLQSYRIWRAGSKEELVDVRRLAPVSEVYPGGDTGEMTWTDTGIEPLKNYYYRLAAVDANGNVSQPTEVLQGRAVDIYLPAPPTWEPAQVDNQSNILSLSWSHEDPNLSCLVQRREANGNSWQNLGSWLPRGQYTSSDSGRDPALSYEYRLLVLDSGGRTNYQFNILQA